MQGLHAILPTARIPESAIWARCLVALSLNVGVQRSVLCTRGSPGEALASYFPRLKNKRYRMVGIYKVNGHDWK